MVNYPIFLNISNKDILIIGAGLAAREKLPKLIKGKANITIISKEVPRETQKIIHGLDSITTHLREIKTTDLDNRFLIFCATNDNVLNKELADYAKSKNIWVNSVDDPENCDFFSMALLEKEKLSLGFSTHGEFAGLSVLLKDIFDTLIPQSHEELIQEVYKIRKSIKKKYNEKKRRKILIKILKKLKKKYF